MGFKNEVHVPWNSNFGFKNCNRIMCPEYIESQNHSGGKRP